MKKITFQNARGPSRFFSRTRSRFTLQYPSISRDQLIPSHEAICTRHRLPPPVPGRRVDAKMTACCPSVIAQHEARKHLIAAHSATVVGCRWGLDGGHTHETRRIPGSLPKMEVHGPSEDLLLGSIYRLSARARG